jgi:flagellar motor switch protein FliM
MATLGEDLSSIEDIGDNFARQVETVIRDAYARMVNDRLITIDSVDVSRRGESGADIRMKWRDLTIDQEFTQPI